MTVVDGHDVHLSPGRKRNIRKTLVMQQMLKSGQEASSERLPGAVGRVILYCAGT